MILFYGLMTARKSYENRGRLPESFVSLQSRKSAANCTIGELHGAGLGASPRPAGSTSGGTKSVLSLAVAARRQYRHGFSAHRARLHVGCCQHLERREKSRRLCDRRCD